MKLGVALVLIGQGLQLVDIICTEIQNGKIMRKIIRK